MKILEFLAFSLLLLAACAETPRESKLQIPDSLRVAICFLPETDLNLGDKLNVVLQKRKADSSFYVVEEFPYISAHDDPKGDRVYRGQFEMYGRTVFEELNFTDSILVSYSAAYYTRKQAPRWLESLTCGINLPPVPDRDSSIVVADYPAYAQEIDFGIYQETDMRVAIAFSLKVPE